MQWKAIYNKETGAIRCTVYSEGVLEIDEAIEGMLACDPSISGTTHKVNVQTLAFESLPMPELVE